MGKAQEKIVAVFSISFASLKKKKKILSTVNFYILLASHRLKAIWGRNGDVLITMSAKMNSIHPKH